MKILVPIKRVPDPYGRVRLTSGGQIDESDIKWVINPFDEIALEEAVRLRERGANVEIATVAIGPSAWEEQLRTSLAMGADRALHVLDDGPTDPGVISHLLAAVCRRENPDLVLMGKQAIDDDFNQTGQRLAALLGWPQATFASQIELAPDGSRARVTREVDSGRETLEVALPAVITTDLRLNEPRYVALPAIIKARNKPLQRLEASELGPRPQPRVIVQSLEAPPPRKAGRRVGSVDELITALREEAKVL
ncbi:MAG TPA: electron transfer flavoprotein subunit beta/FixA family protein [Chthonomonadaceae bacterium]|nr:electron transfer flavoprotein subunit beta/FixA family protein [Chthonomonadaceae bacterium]